MKEHKMNQIMLGKSLKQMLTPKRATKKITMSKFKVTKICNFIENQIQCCENNAGK